MSTVELQYDASTIATLDAALVATSASLSVVKPDGTVHESPTVTLPSVSTTVASGTTASVLTLASVAGIAVGDVLLVTSDGVAYRCVAAVVDATAVTVALRTPLPLVPDTGAAVAKVRLSATIAAPGAANVGINWRLRWTCSDGTDSITDAQPAAVVRQRWVAPIDAADVRQVLAGEFNTVRPEQWCAEVAERVDATIRAAIEATGRRPWAYLSAGAFERAGLVGIRYELSQRGYAHGGQIYEAQRELRYAFDDTLAGVVGALHYDTDDDGTVDADEVPMFSTIQAVR